MNENTWQLPAFPNKKQFRNALESSSVRFLNRTLMREREKKRNNRLFVRFYLGTKIIKSKEVLSDTFLN